MSIDGRLRKVRFRSPEQSLLNALNDDHIRCIKLSLVSRVHAANTDVRQSVNFDMARVGTVLKCHFIKLSMVKANETLKLVVPLTRLRTQRR